MRTTPMTSQAIASYFWCSQTFSTFMQYMRVSHGHNTICGIEYGGCGEDKKKEIVSHQLGVSMGYGDAHQYISMWVSMDCHANGCTRAINVWELNKRN